MSGFEYYNSPLTDFNVLGGSLGGSRIFDNDANTVTYQDYFEVENKTGHTEHGVVAVLPYAWALAPGDGSLGPAGPVPLDFEGDAWTAENFNGIAGLNLEVTGEILPSDHLYTTGSVAAGSIASNPGLHDDFGPSSADYPLKSDLPPEVLEGDDLIPSVNLGDLEAKEDVTLSIKFTYHWTLNGEEVDYNALPTSGAVYTLSPVGDGAIA
jgi:hypothetical protein